jgi:hypothetical protein
VRCWSKNCHLVRDSQRQVTTHNPTLQFRHLTLIRVNTKYHLALWTFKSFPGLSFAEHTTRCIVWQFDASDSYFALSTSWWEGLGLPRGVVWRRSTFPLHVILWIRCAQGWERVLSVHCWSVFVSSFHCHFQLLCFSSTAFPKISCTRNTTGSVLYSKRYTPTKVWYLHKTAFSPLQTG